MFRFVVIVSSIILTLDLLWWWRGDAYARRLPNPRAWRAALAVFMVLQAAGILLLVFARTLGLDRTAGLPTSVLIFIFVWHLLVLPGTIVLALLAGTGWSLAALVALIGRKISSPPAPTRPEPPVQGPSRRQFLAAAAVAVPPLVTVLGSGYAIPQLNRFRIRRFTIPLSSLPRDLDGLTIAQVADVHVGDFTFGRTLDDIVEATNKLRPDLIVMTGDLINRRMSDLPAALDMVRRFDPQSGLFTIEGNHDLFESRQGFEDSVRAAGVPLLLNESRIVQIRGVDVQLLGIRWGLPLQRRGANYEEHTHEVLRLRRPEAFPILLAHHPHAFDIATEAGIPLTFAGHTHGGQLHLTRGIGFGPFMFKYWSGLYRSGDSALVVSNGVGNWFPLRVNAPAEIVHITLRCAET